MELEEDRKILSMLYDKRVIDDSGNLIEKVVTNQLLFLSSLIHFSESFI